jgi:hypothetical protein
MFPNKDILHTGSGPTQPSLPSQPFQTLGISPRTPEQYLSGAIIDVWPVDVMTSLEDTTRMCWPDGDVSGSFVDGSR